MLPNRFIRSATCSYFTDDQGTILPSVIELYQNLAKGGVGLIIKGHLYVHDSGRAHRGMAGISHDGHLPGLRALTQAVHNAEGLIFAQLNHAGLNSYVDRAGPSEYVRDSWKGRALSLHEIEMIIEAFGTAADRAIRAGFDGVQIHGAHGYLISQFLSRLTNRRTDSWGGSLEKRMRFLFTVYDEVRARLRSHIPVLLKMNCDDFSPNGFTIDDSVRVAKAICRRGLDGLEISGGGIGEQNTLRIRAASTNPVLAEASFAGYAQQIREQVQPTPVALVDGIRTRTCMDTVIDHKVADLISMCRPFIMEPALVQQLASGQIASSCTTCGACHARDASGSTLIHCPPSSFQ
ncbi:MAG: NADH:flavin oxidoreductase [Candidatus Bathyarchaeota archaeon]|nr:MAG: NADH:flavin oxidoreductase [Candidatus Bathyarchaeota archaeon]